MPPPLSEESDEYSDAELQLQQDQMPLAPASRPVEEGEVGREKDQAAPKAKPRQAPSMERSQDFDLLIQLQRSAAEEEGHVDVDGNDTSPAADGGGLENHENDDTTMNDAPATDADVAGGAAADDQTSSDDEDDAAEVAVVAEPDISADGQEGDSDSSQDGDGEDSGAEESSDEEDENAASPASGSSEEEDEEEEEVKDEEDDEDEDDDDDDDDDDEDDEDEEDEDDVEHHNCIFCKQTEANGPLKEAESYLTCSACSNRAHQQCARDNEALKDDQESSTWQCISCLSKSTDSESPKSVLARARHSNSAPRLVRDLLPVSRGMQKPNSHSIFAQPLISDGEDGGRSLRKRKSPTQEPLPSGKRRKAGSRGAATTPDTAQGEADRAVAHSTRRASQFQKILPTARILQYRPKHKPEPHKFILAFRLEQEQIEKILSKPPRPGKRRDRKKQTKIPPPPAYQPPVPKFPALPAGHLIFPSIFNEKESDLTAKPYGGILNEQDADTSRSLPQFKDREIFEAARKEAEEERRRTSAAAEVEINGENAVTAKPNRTVSGPPSKIKCIQFGKFVIDTFYAAPYPEEYSHESRLFICEFCLKYLPSEFVAYRHKLKCPAKHPPGDEIYRDGSISIWEVDGRKKTEYCQCLCLMAKMFLGSKTLYYDVEPFLFYILTEYDELGYHFVGYFSKEKRPASQNNVSCILVMPIHQRKGYATFLIDFSYLLTRIEGKEGSPEKPLSDMGLTAYRAYWDLTISRHLLDLGTSSFSTRSLMERTGMTADDVIHSLERLYAFIRDPVTKTYGIRYDKKLYDTIVNDFDSKQHRKLRPDNLVWTPYVMGRSDQANLDGAPMQTIAPREDDMDEESIDQGEADPDAVSPKTSTQQSRKPSPAEDDIRMNDQDSVVPGPPSTDALNATVSTDLPEAQINDIANGDTPEPTKENSLTGYALAHRTYNIPPARFQIEPPIPPSMLRARSTKKRGHGAAFPRGTNANQSPAPFAPLRSSPRNVTSVNGSVNGVKGRGSRQATPEPVRTPVRRSGRKTGLANMELASLDGTNDEARVAESGGEEEEEDDEDEASGSGSGEDEDEESTDTDEEEEAGQEEAEVEEGSDEDEVVDPNAEPTDQEGSSEEEDAEEEGAEEEDAEEEDDDAEGEIESVPDADDNDNDDQDAEGEEEDED